MELWMQGGLVGLCWDLLALPWDLLRMLRFPLPWMEWSP